MWRFFILQRIIAYIYRYRGDENIYRKCGNVGFCRVEEISGRRVINMCFKETYDITRDCEIKELYLDKDVDNNMCRCTVGNIIRKDKICGGQMRLRLQGEKEEGLYIVSGQEKYIVLWYGDREAILLLEEKQEEENDYTHKETVESIVLKEEKIMDGEECLGKEKLEDKENKKDKMRQLEDEQLLRAYNRMAKSPMIIENVMQQVVKLKPQQMVMLPRKYWRLTNNRFLMEGYYVHKHILFFKYAESYVIGVPSFSWENEKGNANKFGFETTLEAYDYGNPNALKKYWLTYLN